MTASLLLLYVLHDATSNPHAHAGLGLGVKVSAFLSDTKLEWRDTQGATLRARSLSFYSRLC